MDFFLIDPMSFDILLDISGICSTFIFKKRTRGKSESDIWFHIPVDHVVDGSFAGVSEIGNLVSRESFILDHLFQNKELFHDLFVSPEIGWGGACHFELRREISSIWVGFLFRFSGVEMTDSLQRIKRDAVSESALQKFLEKIAFEFMPELFESVLAYLKFSECDEIEIEHIIFLFVFAQCSKEFHNASEIICSSRYFQYFIIKALDTETISQSGNFFVFFIQCFHKT